MPDPSVVPVATSGFKTRFFTILTSFCILVALSWPILFSFDLWVFKDRSSFLNLDYLISHLRLGIDVFYVYGLLPVYIQHVVFRLFGRGYQPMVGCTLLVLILSAFFWALILREISRDRRFLWGVVALSPLILPVNPVFPYSLVVLSIQFALYLVLRKRLDLALTAAVVGCFCVPSLPLLLTTLLVGCIVIEWWFSTERSVLRLGRRLLPGFALYATIFAGLSLFFGLRSMMATALPGLGMKFYKANGMDKLSAFLAFLHPPGYSLKYYCAYYVASPVTWFILSTAAILVIGTVAVVRMARGRTIEYKSLCVVLCCLLQIAFICFAYGNRGQHSIYEPVLAAGTLVAISSLPRDRFRSAALLAFVGLGLLGETGQAYKTWQAWRTTAKASDTVGLYSDPVFAADLADILKIASTHRLLMLSYATGVHHYFGDIHNSDVWFLYPGELFPSETRKMTDEIDQSDVIVEDLTSPSAIIEYDADVRAHMQHMHESGRMRNFRIWQRDNTPPIPTTLR